MSTRIPVALGLFSLLAAASSFAACSPDAPSEAAPIDAGRGLDAGEPVGSVDDGGAEAASPDATRPTCNTLTLAGTPTGNAHGTSNGAPAPTGGALADGTYVFTEATYYEMPALSSTPLMRSRMAISGTTMQTIQGAPDPNDASEDRTFTDTISVGATTLTSTTTCPAAGQPKLIGFSVGSRGDGGDAGATTVTFYVEDKGIKAGLVYTRE